MVLFFAAFILLVIGLLALDLGVLHREQKVMSAKAALSWTCFWIAIALLFNSLIFVIYEYHWFDIGRSTAGVTTGVDAFLAFLTAYLVEKSLSVDNIFVIAMVFTYFQIPQELQHRVLFWGIFGAIIMRGAMIGAGIVAISQFSWLTYVLGGFLILTAIRLLIVQEGNFDPEKSLVIRFLGKWLPITHQLHGHHFFVKISGVITATPLFLALVIVESSDVFFAVDSIPAVLAITLDPFIVFTSNVFAILGMRSLYFALASLLDRFRHLKTSLVFVLGFVGVKMILAHHIPINSLISLSVIVAILAIGIFASMFSTRKPSSLNREEIKEEIGRISRITAATVKKLFFFVAGVTVFLIGAVMLLLPGPGLLVMLLGLGLLAVEFVWARVWIRKIKGGMHEIQRGARSLLKRENRPCRKTDY